MRKLSYEGRESERKRSNKAEKAGRMLRRYTQAQMLHAGSERKASSESIT